MLRGSLASAQAFAACALALLLAGCAGTGLLTREDYQLARESLASGDPDGARINLPRGETGGFITTMEKTYLALLQGRPDIDALAQQAAALEDRVRYHVSREARTFFYMQTPEDYYASEHEVVWMHLLLSWGYSLRGERERACVEARIAGSLLDLPWSPSGHFDDPALRIFLAALWAMCGSWREAQVDFRAAWKMDASLDWARALADRDDAPAHLVVVLGGTGPEPYWNPDAGANPLRSGRQVGFRLRGARSTVQVADAKGLRVAAHRSPDAAAWYERHLARNNEIQELIADSHYGKDIVVHGGVASVKIGASTAAGIAWGVGGVVLGAVVIRAAVEASSGEGVALGLSIAASGIAKGTETARSGYRSSTRELEERLDPSPGYRYVRFLPDYFWVASSDAPLEYPLQVASATWLRPSVRPATGDRRGRPTVSIAFLADVESGSTRRRNLRP
jgi:hypothetical protein